MSENTKEKGTTKLEHQSLLWRSPSNEPGFSLYNQIQNSPCMPEALRTSIYIGLGTALVTFLCTSNMRRASFWAYASFSVSILPTLMIYRYRLLVKHEEAQRTQSALQSHILYEGTEYEKELDRLLGKKSGNSDSDKTQNRDWDLDSDKRV